MVKHSIINGIKYKYCGCCSELKTLDQFGKSTETWDQKKPQCFACINKWKKICSYIDCETYAVHGYELCKKHGGGKKCILCDIPARSKSDYCVKHNPNKCKYESCDGKPVDNTFYCTIHNEDYRCKHPNCVNKKTANKNGYCKTHGVKEYCEAEGCDKIIKWGKMCDEHHCSGNIERCARILITRSIKQDKELNYMVKKNRIMKKRIVARDNNLNYQYIVELYNKNKNCHWCNNILKLEIGGSFDLSRISIDRIDNKKGHIIDNIVLSCMFCNYAKNVCSIENWKKVIQVLNGKTHCIDFSIFKFDPRIFKPLSTSVAKGKIDNMVNKEWMINQLKQNIWKCSLTGFPLYSCTERYFPWGVSIDRIDGNQQHTKENCQITARFINLGKNRMPDDEFKIWFKNRFPKCRIDMVIYPVEFYDKILCKDLDTYIDMISNKDVKVLFVNKKT